LLDEGVGGALHLREAEVGRAGGVEQERDGERLVDGGEVGDALLDAVLEDAEVFEAEKLFENS